jgi:hypothetical protein
MTEKELINLGFERVYITDEDSGNGYDYFYYTLDIMEGLRLVSCGNDELVNYEWYVVNHDWPNAVITDAGTISNLIDFAEKWCQSNS